MSVKTESTQQKASPPEASGLLPIALGTLAPADRLEFDLFIRSDAGKPVLFRGRSYSLDEEDIERLRRNLAQTLYIRVAEHEEYCEFLRQVVLENPDLPGAQRAQVLTAINRAVFDNAFKSPNVKRYLEFAQQFGEDLTNVICENDVALGDLIQLMSHDYYTFTHVANVTTYCLALACGMGIKDRQTLKEITIGGLLHDYGKRHIPVSVLNATGRLTEDQRMMIQQHPLLGFRELSWREEMTWGQLMMVYQHHERPDGNGYPVGSGGDDIHPWARICKVADVFAALTCDRPYRRADSPAKVIEFMQIRVGREFDAEVVQCLQAMINY